MKKRTITYASDYEGLPIMTNAEKKQGCDTKILQMLKDKADTADGRPKTFFMRYDIRFPEHMNVSEDNQLAREFQANFMKNLTRQGLQPEYLMVREQSKEKHQHYHCALWLDGNRTQSIHNHIKTAERLWDSALGLDSRPEGYGLIDDCTKHRNGTRQQNGVMLRHDDPDYEAKKAECFRRASYLAKINTKSDHLDGHREVFASRSKMNKAK